MSRESKGNGLSIVTRGGSSLWEYQFRSRVTKTTTSQILGPTKGAFAITLTQARVKRNEVFAANRAGTLVPRRKYLRSQTATSAQHGSCKTFAEALEVFVVEKRARYKGTKEVRVFENLARLPLARLPLDEIDRNTVKASLTQWFGTPTAEKMRIKIGQVFKHEGRIGRDNPAEQLKSGLPAVEKPVEHHPAMSAEDVPGLMSELATFDTPAARALRWTILTAARAGETLGMTWGEINLDKALWAIPGERMKEGKAHSVPLTPEMLALLGPRGDDGKRVFGLRDSRTMGRFVEGLDCSVHGFRSTFTDWAAESGWEFELREIALAHAVSGATSQAYNRSKQVDRRRAMMTAWARFATETP